MIHVHESVSTVLSLSLFLSKELDEAQHMYGNVGQSQGQPPPPVPRRERRTDPSHSRNPPPAIPPRMRTEQGVCTTHVHVFGQGE